MARLAEMQFDEMFGVRAKDGVYTFTVLEEDFDAVFFGVSQTSRLIAKVLQEWSRGFDAAKEEDLP